MQGSKKTTEKIIKAKKFNDAVKKYFEASKDIPSELRTTDRNEFRELCSAFNDIFEPYFKAIASKRVQNEDWDDTHSKVYHDTYNIVIEKRIRTSGTFTSEDKKIDKPLEFDNPAGYLRTVIESKIVDYERSLKRHRKHISEIPPNYVSYAKPLKNEAGTNERDSESIRYFQEHKDIIEKKVNDFFDEFNDALFSLNSRKADKTKLQVFLYHTYYDLPNEYIEKNLGLREGSAKKHFYDFRERFMNADSKILNTLANLVKKYNIGGFIEQRTSVNPNTTGFRR